MINNVYFKCNLYKSASVSKPVNWIDFYFIVCLFLVKLYTNQYCLNIVLVKPILCLDILHFKITGYTFPYFTEKGLEL